MPGHSLAASSKVDTSTIFRKKGASVKKVGHNSETLGRAHEIVSRDCYFFVTLPLLLARPLLDSAVAHVGRSTSPAP